MAEEKKGPTERYEELVRGRSQEIIDWAKGELGHVNPNFTSLSEFVKALKERIAFQEKFAKTLSKSLP